MAKKREKVPEQTKRALVSEAGAKCANPGCPVRRIHIHHIRRWAVYETHDQSQMVAVCPTCHDAIHNGSLEISDETVYQWKSIRRSSNVRSHIYVEPNESMSLIFGSIRINANAGARVFGFSQSMGVSFSVKGRDIYRLNLEINDQDGIPIVRILDSDVEFINRQAVNYHEVTGRLQVTTPASSGLVPEWVRLDMERIDSSFHPDGTVTLLETEVLKPGVVKVQGVWIDGGRYLVAVDSGVFITTPTVRNFSLVGDGTIEFGDEVNLGTVLDFGMGTGGLSLFAIG